MNKQTDQKLNDFVKKLHSGSNSVPKIFGILTLRLRINSAKSGSNSKFHFNRHVRSYRAPSSATN